MNPIKRLLIVIGSAGLIVLFQNCGQSGSIAASGTEQFMKIEDVQETDGSVLPPSMVRHENEQESEKEADNKKDRTDEPAKHESEHEEYKEEEGHAEMRCEDEELLGLSVADVKAPSASKASSHFLEMMSDSVVLKLGANAIKVKATDDAIKLDKMDLILSEKLKGKKIRIMLDRKDYVAKNGKKYELRFSLAKETSSEKSMSCHVIIVGASFVEVL